jgi:dihydroflavonol-4-reductase
MTRKISGQVLVTGGSGFIGQHLVSALVARNRHVRILDLRPPCSVQSEIQYVSGSGSDPAAADEALNGVDEVYHLAGLPGMWSSNRGDFASANVRCTEVMLAAARRRSVARFLHCSTESILFGVESSDGFITEQNQYCLDDMPGVYTRSKKAAEDRALSAAAEGLNVVIANPTMPIGPHIYELTPPTAMIEYFLGKRIQFYLNCTLNLVDVRDVAAGLMLVMERGEVGGRYILGGQNTSLRELLKLIAALTSTTRVSIPIPATAALAIARTMELFSDYVSQRTPAATSEGVAIALRAKPLSSTKAINELGYASRSLDIAVRETIYWLNNRTNKSLAAAA